MNELVKHPEAAFLAAYLVVLTVHFIYACYLIHSGKDSLAIGPFQKPATLLALLLLLNGFSLTVLAWPTPAWIRINIGLHALLALDEAWRLREARLRLPFLINHLLFSAALNALLQHFL